MLQPNSLLFNYVNVVELARTPLHKYILLGQTQGSNSSLYSFTPWTDEVVRTPLHFDLHREQSKWVTFLSMCIHSVNSRNGSHSSLCLSTPWTVEMAHIPLHIIHTVNSQNGSHSSLYLSTPCTVEMAHIHLYIYPLREQLRWLTFLSLFIHFVNSWNGSHSSPYVSSSWTD